MEYITVDEAAKRFRAHPETVRRWCRRGLIPACKIGKKWLILQDKNTKEENK